MVSCFKGKFRVTSPYGFRTLAGKREFHKGIDLVGVDDGTVYAISGGVVRTGFQANGAGRYIVITQDDGMRVFYMHLAKYSVKNGDTVRKGDAIGVMGSTGRSFGVHTHLEIRPKGTGAASINISEYTKIPNKVGTYFYDEEKENAMTQNEFEEMLEKYLSKRSAEPPSAWSERARKYCESHGLIVGDGSGSGGYRSFVTKEEAAEIAYKIVSGLTGSL